MVVVGALMVVAFVVLRRAAGGDGAPAAAQVARRAHDRRGGAARARDRSLLHDGRRPAWDSPLGPLTLLGAACAAGPLTFAVIEAARGEAAGRATALFSLVGSIANLAASVAYLAFMEMASASYTDVGYYYDPTHPTAGMVDVSALSPFAGESVAMVAVARRGGGGCRWWPPSSAARPATGRSGAPRARSAPWRRRGPAHGLLLRRRQRVFVLLA